jgi:dephospho-CoA kinase
MAHGAWRMADRKPVIGLAGGIGSGKTEVARILAGLGCVVADADAIARQALREPQVRDTLVGWWGDDVLDADGEIDRAAVASIAFGDAEERRRLEALVHPRVEARRRELFDAAPPEAPALVIDAPLLFEAGLDAACDAVIFVDADEAIRRERVASSRGWEAAELARREESQLPLDEKRERADYVLRNNGELSELTARVRRLLRTIVGSCRS